MGATHPAVAPLAVAWDRRVVATFKPGLRPEELARYRQIQNEHLATAGLTVVRRAITSDGAGGQTRDYQPLDDAVTARLGLPTDAELQIIHERWGTEPRWTVTVPHGTMLQPLDRIAFDGQGVLVELVGRLSIWSWETAERHAAIEVAA